RPGAGEGSRRRSGGGDVQPGPGPPGPRRAVRRPGLPAPDPGPQPPPTRGPQTPRQPAEGDQVIFFSFPGRAREREDSSPCHFSRPLQPLHFVEHGGGPWQPPSFWPVPESRQALSAPIPRAGLAVGDPLLGEEPIMFSRTLCHVLTVLFTTALVSLYSAE